MNFLISFVPFFDYHYLFNPSPVPLGPALVGGVFAFFSFFVAAAVTVRVVAGGMRKKAPLEADIARRFSRLLGTTGVLGLLLLFFAYEQLPVLGMRFWIDFLALFFLGWLARIILHVVRDYPRDKTRADQRERFERYLPGRA